MPNVRTLIPKNWRSNWPTPRARCRNTTLIQKWILSLKMTKAPVVRRRKHGHPCNQFKIPATSWANRRKSWIFPKLQTTRSWTTRFKSLVSSSPKSFPDAIVRRTSKAMSNNTISSGGNLNPWETSWDGMFKILSRWIWIILTVWTSEDVSLRNSS